MEKVDELKGEGNSLDFGARIYDSRLGRWLSRDPLEKNFPSLSPYQFVENKPIYYIDPDGRKIIVADDAQQAVVLGYLRDQFGTDVFKFNKRGALRLDKKAYKAEQVRFKQEQVEIAKGLIKVIKSSRIIEIVLYEDKNINFSRNPIVPIRDLDPITGEIRIEHYFLYEKDQVFQLPELNQPDTTLYIDGDYKAFILINRELSNKETFKGEKGTSTKSCESCVFIHEVLDHGLDYIKTGSVSEPEGSSKKDNVHYHNQALKNKGSIERTGEDHD